MSFIILHDYYYYFLFLETIILLIFKCFNYLRNIKVTIILIISTTKKPWVSLPESNVVITH